MVTSAPAGSVAMVSAPASHPLRRGAWSCLTETAWAEAAWTKRNRSAKVGQVSDLPAQAGSLRHLKAAITQSYGVARKSTLSRTPYGDPGVYCLLMARLGGFP